MGAGLVYGKKLQGQEWLVLLLRFIMILIVFIMPPNSLLFCAPYKQMIITFQCYSKSKYLFMHIN